MQMKFCAFCGQQFAENANTEPAISPTITPADTVRYIAPPQPLSPVNGQGKKSYKFLWIAGGGLMALLFFVGIGGIAAYGAYRYFKDTDSSPLPNPPKPPISSKTISISAEDMTLLTKDAPVEDQAKLAADAANRKTIAHQIFQVLALAEEAKASGIADRPEIKRQLDYVRASAAAQDYIQNLIPGYNSSQSASENEIKEFLSEPGQEDKFSQMLKDSQAMDSSTAAPPTPKQSEEFKKQWATTYINERKAIAAGLDKQRKTQLQILLKQSSFLSQIYAKQHEGQLRATDEEIKNYLINHPELDTKNARSRAKDLLKRVQSGEDFAALANQFSEDPANKKTYGGLYTNVKKGQMVQEFESAALALDPGQISNQLIETDYGFHIIKLEDKKDNSYTVRHIIIVSSIPDPSKPEASVITLREQATEAVENRKINAVTEKYQDQIMVAEDFEVAVSSAANNSNKTAVSAKEIFTAYKTDAAAADGKYKGKTAEISGTIETAGTDLAGKVFALFAVGDSANSVRCTFPDAAKAAVTALKPGQSATFGGMIEGSLAGDVMLSNCSIR